MKTQHIIPVFLVDHNIYWEFPTVVLYFVHLYIRGNHPSGNPARHCLTSQSMSGRWHPPPFWQALLSNREKKEKGGGISSGLRTTTMTSHWRLRHHLWRQIYFLILCTLSKYGARTRRKWSVSFFFSFLTELFGFDIANLWGKMGHFSSNYYCLMPFIC